jgi:hypothetical protein
MKILRTLQTRCESVAMSRSSSYERASARDSSENPTRLAWIVADSPMPLRLAWQAASKF